MGETRVLFFWTSGVLLPALDAAVTEILPSFGIAGINPAAISRYREMRDDLALGRIDGQEFCQVAVRSLGIEGSPELFLKRMLSRLVLIPGVLDAVTRVKAEVDRWLVVDLPEAWFKELPSSQEVLLHFPPERIICLEDSRLLRVLPDVFYYLPNRVQVPSEQCLLLDSDIKRTVHSINHGLPAAVVINPERLRRELLMRRLIMQDYQIHQRPV
ncbi:MAG: hypothetical protein HPY55_03170 [Firmicutes bacterium]|nr:hypothetical protein [Bacillota bacterium]